MNVRNVSYSKYFLVLYKAPTKHVKNQVTDHSLKDPQKFPQKHPRLLHKSDKDSQVLQDSHYQCGPEYMIINYSQYVV